MFVRLTEKKFFTEDKSFYPMTEIFGKKAEELNIINEEDFNNLFSKSPVKRTKFLGWKRNILSVILTKDL